MGIASCTAASAGAIVTPLFYINPFMGGGVVFKALLIVAVGGMGSIEGSDSGRFLDRFCGVHRGDLSGAGGRGDLVSYGYSGFSFQAHGGY